MQVGFAKITCDPLKLDKTADYTAASPTTKTVQISNPVNVETPHFILEIPFGGDFDFNYCYVQKWGRYYFLGEPTYLDGNRLTVSGVCDVLTSYADDIKALSINVHRSSTGTNSRIADNMQPSQANRQCETIAFKDCLLGANYATDIVYVLSVQGGAHR